MTVASAPDGPQSAAAHAWVAADHAFRHAYATLVSRLARQFGFHRIEAAEDAVQSALMAALRTWPRSGMPDEPQAWLYRVARNQLIDALRRHGHGDLSIEDAFNADDAPAAEPATADARFEQEIGDDELRMLFVCADEAIPLESQLVLALKVLCGFSTREIALRLLTSEENVYKRLSRARDRLREIGPSLDTPLPPVLQARRGAVLQMVYLLFNEGYSSATPDRLIRRELCDEAMRLGRLIVEHPASASASAEGDALMALMLLHAARFEARVDGNGGLLLLEDQDRSRWDVALIHEGLKWLERAARGEVFTRYHAEAAVAAQHCIAPSFERTDWPEIVRLYQALERLSPSPLHTLNRAIAVSEWQGPAAGLAVLQAIKPPGWLAGYYLWDATLGELQRRTGRLDEARQHLLRAIESAPHPAEKQLLRRRLLACGS